MRRERETDSAGQAIGPAWHRSYASQDWSEYDKARGRLECAIRAEIDAKVPTFRGHWLTVPERKRAIYVEIKRRLMAKGINESLIPYV